MGVYTVCRGKYCWRNELASLVLSILQNVGSDVIPFVAKKSRP